MYIYIGPLSTAFSQNIGLVKIQVVLQLFPFTRMTLWHMQFLFWGLWTIFFLLLAYVSQGVCNVVLRYCWKIQISWIHNLDLSAPLDISFSNSKVFFSVSLCPCLRYICGKCKDLQRRGKIYQVFCLGGTIAIKVTECSSARKIFHECDLLDLDTDDV